MQNINIILTVVSSEGFNILLYERLHSMEHPRHNRSEKRENPIRRCRRCREYGRHANSEYLEAGYE